MVEQKRLINSQFNSNTYILSMKDEVSVWLVDPGDVQPVFDWMKRNNQRELKGILLTHTHFDHIYGVNEILREFPECAVFVANEYGKEGLTNIKQNGSKYTGNPIVIEKPDNVRFFESEMNLWPKVTLSSQITPGHSDDSICFMIENLLFTGDTLLRGLRTVTKIRGGSVEKLTDSIQYFKQWQGLGYHVCPGHGEEFMLDGYDLQKAFGTCGKKIFSHRRQSSKIEI